MPSAANSSTGVQKPRVEPRIRAVVRAQLHDSTSVRDCCVIDVSTRGLLVTTANPPKRGEFVEFRIGRHEIAGQVKWAGPRRFGVALQERVSPSAVIEGGKGEIALHKSVGQLRRRQGIGTALTANPDMFGRAVQFIVLLVCAAVAAYLAFLITGASFEPLNEVTRAMQG